MYQRVQALNDTYGLILSENQILKLALALILVRKQRLMEVAF